MATYIGKRIVPVHCGKWDMGKAYEMLSIVLEETSGDSYIARRAVPSGTAITDTYYWMLHSLYSQQIKDMSDHLIAAEARIKADNDATEAAIRQDNAETREHVDSSLQETTETLTDTVTQARTAMTQQKEIFDATAASLTTRMDAVLAAGTGDGATEVLDGRVDYDGNSHASLGEAIRTSDASLKNRIDRNEDILYDIHKKEHVCKLYNGSPQNHKNAYAVRTEPIPVKTGDIVECFVHRELLEGEHYSYAILGLDAEGKEVISTTYSAAQTNKVVNVTNARIVSIEFGVAVYDSENKNMTLRQTSFSGDNYVYVEITSANALMQKVNHMYTDVNKSSLWAIGGLGSVGENYARNFSVRTNTYLTDTTPNVEVDDGYQITYLCLYGTGKTFLKRISVNGDNISILNIFRNNPSAVYYRIEVNQIVDGEIDRTALTDTSMGGHVRLYSHVDQTLTKPGIAADAYITGRWIDSLVADHNSEELWQIGSIGSNGENYTDNNYIRTRKYLKNVYQLVVRADGDYFLRVSLYDENKGFLHRFEYYSLSKETVIRLSDLKESYPTAAYLRCNICRVTDGAIDKTVQTDTSLYSAMKIYATASFKEIDVNEIYENLQEGTHDIPSYYMEHLKKAEVQINKNIETMGRNGETFIFITDIHWETNYRNSPPLVRHILKNTRVNLMLSGGDFINQGTKDSRASLIRDLVKQFYHDKAPMIPVFGNHDSNTLNSSGNENKRRTFTKEMIHGLMFKQASHLIHWHDDENFDFWFDRDDSKIRFIGLSTGTNGGFKRYSSLADMLMGMPEGYHAVIYFHWCQGGSHGLTTSAKNITRLAGACTEKTSVTVNEQEYDFSSAGGSVDAIICGHTHYDDWYEPNDPDNYAGVPIFTVDTDSWRVSSGLEKGTITEQCFDVITVDYARKTVKCVRIGRGENRYYSYDPEASGFLADVTNILTNVVTDNETVDTLLNRPYEATITADDGYVIADLSVQMGGVDITETVYQGGRISIPNVTGDLVIKATGEEA